MDKQKIVNYLRKQPNKTLIKLYNDFIDTTGDPDDKIYEMEHIDSYFEGESVTFLFSIIAKDFNINHNYFTFNVKGKLCSFNEILKAPSVFNLVIIAEWLIANNHSFLKSLKKGQ